MDLHVGALGLDPAAEVGQGHSQLLATLTDRRLLFASVGFVSIKPKQLVVEVPIESVRLEWWDRTERTAALRPQVPRHRITGHSSRHRRRRTSRRPAVSPALSSWTAWSP
jgi:hypothetical protein